ncbi:PREDICTED: leucine-rich repeat-containing protein 15-like [Branchiostoma belcheri]|uniref:Leucine-rich repeat-containing protein 15-like n=1 Tax=Branchiostoma belcheri TaxID=7741 RepID=A0A6P5AF22_BRABE|nr:PREDICTED: leucine-rich repeat-containing protein 15-like [Branchiostoma belcheri]
MARKLRHMLIFLLIILKEPDMPGGSGICPPSSINSIQVGAFSNLCELYHLNLNFNKISSIQFGTISDLPNLKWLNLKGNHISSIQVDTFLNLPELSNNQHDMGRKLSHLLIFLLVILKDPNMPGGSGICEPSSYGMCQNLGLTSIPQNLPSSISVGSFTNLPCLEVLTLSSNKLSHILLGTFYT